ncbi:MAG: hypothetical protein KKF27_21330 [Gammaproteobacteria bacterium]|nr:hypothetical protein [Gammaproteobacteria bacterium]
MPWSKLDDQFHDHPKVAAAGVMATGLFALALSWTADKLTDGFIPTNMVRRLAADVDDPIALAEKLVRVGLFEKREDGYQIHDYLVYNPSKEDVLKRRAERQEAGRRGGLRSSEARRQPDDEPTAEVPDEATTEATAQASAEATASANANPVSRTPLPVSQDQDSATHSAGSAPSKREKSPQRRQHDAVVQAMRDWFAKQTGIDPPTVKSANQRAGYSKLWWNPLREIAEKASFDLAVGKDVIDESLMALKSVNITDPNSILKTARAIADKRRNGRDGGVKLKSVVDVIDPLTGEACRVEARL